MGTAANTHMLILEQQPALAKRITQFHFHLNPSLQIKFGKQGREKCAQNAQYHLSYLAESIKAESQELFGAYVEWAASMLQSRKVPLRDLIDNLNCTDRACKESFLPEDYRTVTTYIEHAIQRLSRPNSSPATYFRDDNPLLTSSKQYLTLLLEGDRKQAQSLILDLVTQGNTIPAIYEHIFQVTQYEVGLLWQTNKITAAHEHYCTAATQLIMASLYSHIFDSKKKGVKMMGCTVSGDLHEMGIRMLSDYFEMDGWDTYYLGANMPAAGIVSSAKEQRADVLAVSVTMPFHIRKAESLIKKIRTEPELSGLKVIVGGYPFNTVPDLWKKIGADGSAFNAKEAVMLANQLIS